MLGKHGSKECVEEMGLIGDNLNFNNAILEIWQLRIFSTTQQRLFQFDNLTRTADTIPDRNNNQFP